MKRQWKTGPFGGTNTFLFRHGRMPLTLLWKRRCAVYQLTSAAATQISHKLVYGADELYFFKGASLGFMVLDFRERSEGGRGQKVGPIDRGVRRSIYVFA